MSKICEICGKKPLFGHNVSHANNKTNRRWEPNLKKVKIVDGGTVRSIKICTSCLKRGVVQKAA